MYTIQSNIKIPSRGQGRPSKYPFSNMKPGDSFFKPSEKPLSALRSVHGAIRSWRARTGQAGKFTSRRVIENGVAGVRVWRLK